MNIERSFNTAMDIHRYARSNGQRIIRMTPIKSSEGTDGFVIMSVPEPAPVEKPRVIRKVPVR